MSFSQFLKDYINNLNDFYDSFSGHINPVFLLKFSLFYIIQSIKFLAKYVFTFRWLNDFYSFKITIPQIISSNFNSCYSSNISISNFFNFFDNPGFTPNLFIIGLVNGLINSIPCSSSQFLWLRRLTVEGPTSGLASGLGIVSSQFLLNIYILLGLRFIIFSWFSFGLINYICSIILTLGVVYIIAHKPIKRIKSSDTTQLVKIFILHFVLTWTEQSTVFQYLSNVSFNPEPTLFEALAVDKGIYSILSHWIYFSGLLFGSILWTTFFGWVVLSIGYSSSKFFNFPYSIWVRNFNYLSLVFLIALTLTSLPYYNLDYLVASPLGFIGQDDALKNLHLRVNSIDLKKGRLGEYSSHTSLDTDVSIFDRSRYQTASEVELTFEDLNYQGEYIWRSRNDRLSSGSVGLVNRLISKFLPKLKTAKSKLIADARSKNIRNKKNIKIKPEVLEDDLLDEDEEDDEEFDTIDPSSFIDYENLIKRFISDYQADVTISSLPEPYDIVDREPYSAFSELARYAFDSFATFEEVDFNELEEKLGRRIKSKYYSNIVYKKILDFDLLNFLGRQPKSYSLTRAEEDDLFQKRLILANYYDNLRDYSKMPYFESFKDLFLGPKSYANRVYNNQFKGTLKIVRRLFSISLERKYNRNQENVLKFDQPLYNEELSDQNPLLHEELYEPYLDRIETPFLREVDSIPFYAGWDNKLRKFIITNYWLAPSYAGFKMNYPKVFSTPNLIIKRSSKKSNLIHFITWPISKQKMEKLKSYYQKSSALMFSKYDDPANELQRDIFEYAESGDNDIRIVYETLPSILKRVDLRDKEKEQIYVRPLRGGIVWPGNEPSRLSLRDILEIIKKIGRDWRDSNP